MRALFLFCFLVGCAGGGNPTEFLKPVTSDNKLAVVIKRYQYTTCKTSCLVDEYEQQAYANPDTGDIESWLQCPLDYMEFICIDLYKTDDKGENVVYKLSPQEWQEEAAHLFGFYSHEQIKQGISQVEFLCGQDFAKCEDHLEPLQALVQFHYERESEDSK